MITPRVEPAGWAVAHESFDYGHQNCTSVDASAMKVRMRHTVCSLGRVTKIERIYIQYIQESLLLKWYWRRLGAM